MAEKLSNSVVWNYDEIIPLRKHQEHCLTTPCIVKIASTNKNHQQLPNELYQQDLLLHSISQHQKVLCQCVDSVSKENQLIFSKQKFSVPMSYSGWFEVLSGDGKAIPPCRNITDVAAQMLERFLVRRKVKAYLCHENGEPNLDKSREIQEGEVMSVIGDLDITYGWRKQRKRLLHCLDANGFHVHFDFKSNGSFSPIYGGDNVSGVHTIEGIISHFRLPVIVRVVTGKIPQHACDNDRPGVFRLLETQVDTIAQILPITLNQKLVPISVRTNLLLHRAQNMKEVSRLQYFTHVLDCCHEKVAKYYETMQVLVSAKTGPSNQNLKITPKSKSFSSNKNECDSRLSEEDALFAEIDELYAYIRRGGMPPKMNGVTLTSEAENISDHSSGSQFITNSSGKPRGHLARLTYGKFPTKLNTAPHKRTTTIPLSESEYLLQLKRSSQKLLLGKSSIFHALMERQYIANQSSNHKSNCQSSDIRQQTRKSISTNNKADQRLTQNLQSNLDASKQSLDDIYFMLEE